MSASNWNLNLNEEQVTEIKRFFDQWQEVQERKKELSAENKAICMDAAKVFDGKQTDASKLFKNMAQLCEGEDAEANNISLLLDRLHGGSGSGN
jgi:histidyl-tRNA synthetase